MDVKDLIRRTVNSNSDTVTASICVQKNNKGIDEKEN